MSVDCRDLGERYTNNCTNHFCVLCYYYQIYAKRMHSLESIALQGMIIEGEEIEIMLMSNVLVLAWIRHRLGLIRTSTLTTSMETIWGTPTKSLNL